MQLLVFAEQRFCTTASADKKLFNIVNCVTYYKINKKVPTNIVSIFFWKHSFIRVLKYENVLKMNTDLQSTCIVKIKYSYFNDLCSVNYWVGIISFV